MDEEFRSETPGWSSLSLAQIVLPVVCAAFVAIVVIVLACCLTRRGSRTKGKFLPRSKYSMETSNDTSECGIYDIIEEVLSRPCSKAPTGRLNLGLSCPPTPPDTVRHKHRPDPGTGVKQAPAMRPTMPGHRTAHMVSRSDPVTRTSEVNHEGTVGQLEDRTSKGIAFIEERAMEEFQYMDNDRTSVCGDDGDYETLDRYWKINQVNKADKTVKWPVECTFEIGSDTEEPPQTRDKLPAPPVSVETGGATEPLLCQLTVFSPPGHGAYAASTSHTVCFYYMEGVTQNKDDLLDTLQRSRLLVVPKSLPDLEPRVSTPGDIFLSPMSENVTETDKSHTYPMVSTISVSNPYARIGKPERYVDRKSQLRKSKSFHGAKTCTPRVLRREYNNRRRCSDFINLTQGSNAMGYSNCLTEDDLKRILTKLGPLPPLPTTETRPSVTPKDTLTDSLDNDKDVRTETNPKYCHQPTVVKDNTQGAKGSECCHRNISHTTQTQSSPNYSTVHISNPVSPQPIDYETKTNPDAPPIGIIQPENSCSRGNNPECNGTGRIISTTKHFPTETLPGDGQCSARSVGDSGCACESPWVDNQSSSVSRNDSDSALDTESESGENFYFILEDDAAYLEKSDDEFTGIVELFM